MTAEIRPRGRWESIDLGCALVRANYGKVMFAWFVTVVPLWFGIAFLSQLWPWAEGRPWMTLLVCWILLPLCDRVPLYVVSRALFGERVRMMDLMKAWPRMLLRRFFWTAFFTRFSPNRGLSQPVAELEGLKGKAYSSRVNLLARNGGEGATQAIFIGWVLLLATMFSLMFVYFSFLGLFGDNVVIEELWLKHVIADEAAFMPVGIVWSIVALYLSAVTLIEPFFVGAGFSMYINSRTVTEGWDIELAFKRMSERVRKSMADMGKRIVSLMAIGFVIFGMFGETVRAEDAEAKERLSDVLADEDFVIHREMENVPSESKSDSGSDYSGEGLGFVGAIGQVLFYVIIVAAVGGLVWLIYANRHVFQSGGRGEKLVTGSGVKSVMGMDVSLESLPSDVVKAARDAWARGEKQMALSLLYRGSIAWLVNDGGVMIGEGDTEQDCERAVIGTRGGEVAKCFSKLTGMWVRLAYGERSAEESDFEEVCAAWPFKGHPVEAGDGV